MEKTVIIAGAGASGMFAALQAAIIRREAGEPPLKLIILEAEESPGKKLLVTGNGRCNLCNRNLNEKQYYTGQPDFVREVLKQYDAEAVIRDFGRFGIALKEKNGYFYPASGQASLISQTLYSLCLLSGITFHFQCQVTGIVREKDGRFRIEVYEKETAAVYHSDAVIISCGSPAGLTRTSVDPITGSLKKLGHHFYPFIPSLCGLKALGKQEAYRDFFKKTAGVRTEIQVCVQETGQKYQSQGELQITDYGLSGIVIFQISHVVSSLLHRKKEKSVPITVDFLPEWNENEVRSLLRGSLFYEKKSLSDLFNGLLNAKLSLALVNLYARLSNSPVKPFFKNIDDTGLLDVIHFIKHTPFEITDTNPIRQSQVCAGGIALDEINPATMESRIAGNLYLTGEILDADGLCGGYNLQWAWSTGKIAGRSIANDTNHPDKTAG